MIYDPLLSNENLIENDIKENNINENNINEKIPQSILNFLTKENYTLVRFKGIKSIQKVKCAHFNMVKNNNFSFEFEEKENFYFFIVKQENENYIKKIKKII